MGPSSKLFAAIPQHSLTEVLALPESEARDMARHLAREEGIFAGTSTGLDVLAALWLADEIGAGGPVVTAACDTGFQGSDCQLFRDQRAEWHNVATRRSNLGDLALPETHTSVWNIIQDWLSDRPGPCEDLLS